MHNKIIGHQRQRENLRRLLLRRRLPTTLMFSGIQGIGKLLVAKELYRTLFCSHNQEQITPQQTELPSTVHYGGCSSCHGCRIFDLENTPDLFLVECLDKKRWNLEGLREMLYSLNLKPFSGSVRVVIFNDAEHLSLQAANALLKVLEEPRPGTYFCMISANPSRLPQTLLSRSQIWFFDSLTQLEIEQILQENLADKLKELNFKIEEISALADGSLAGIESIVENFDAWQDLTAKLSQIVHGDLQTVNTLTAELSKDKERLRDQIRLMRIYARMQLHEVSSADAQAKWAVTLSNLISSERMLFDRHLAPAYVLSNLFLNLVPDSCLNSFARYPGSDIILEKQII